MVGQCAESRRARLASHYLYQKERTAFRHFTYVYTFILLPFVAGFNLQRLVSVLYFIVPYDDSARLMQTF